MNSPVPPNFLGIPEETSRYEDAQVAVLPVPYEATVSYGRGTAKGPAAIIRASNQVELYDEDLGFEPYKIGVATLDPLSVSGLEPKKMIGRVKSAVEKILSDGKLPVVLGGEHSITPAAVGAVKERYGEITVVQFDAHADLRQKYEGNSHNHACAMARVLEICAVVHLGIRNISIDEAHFASKNNLPIFYAHKMYESDSWMDEAIARIRTRNVYITIDCDAFDSAIMPATGTPEPGGLNWYQITGFLKKLISQKRAVGFDLMELAPIEGFHSCDFLCAKLVYKCIGLWAGRRR